MFASPILLMTLLSPIVCPRWLGDGATLAPQGIHLTNKQRRANKLRCYWEVVKPAETLCKTRNPPPKCEERTDRWLTTNFSTPTTLNSACYELRQRQDETATTIMMTTWKDD